MRAVLPGKPQARLQTLSSVQWDNLRLVVYISGNALNILTGPHTLLQTIYHDGCIALDSVDISASTGKIATCDLGVLYIYQPHGQEEDAVKWSLQGTFPICNETLRPPVLSWGSDQELLLGTSSLKLLQIEGDVSASVIWDRKLPNPVKLASFSHDASLIASTGYYDCLIKVWRRQSFGYEDTGFNFTYLSHPAVVTGVCWNKIQPGQHPTNDILYSICADRKVRVWAATDVHGLQALHLSAEIDMLEAIQPRLGKSPVSSQDRYALFINGEDFGIASRQLLATKPVDDNNGAHASEHLSEIRKKDPEICMILDADGHMSAWGLQSIGCKARTTANNFNITHVDDFRIPIIYGTNEEENNLHFLTFYEKGARSNITLLVHHFDGRVQWLESRPDKLFDQSPRGDRMEERALWTGHTDQINKIFRTTSGRALMSRTGANDGLIWKQRSRKMGLILTRASTLSCPEHIHRTCLLQEGDIVVNLHSDKITVWDARFSVAKQVASCSYEMQGKPLCLILLPLPSRETTAVYLATISSTMKGIVWEVQLHFKSGKCPDTQPQAAIRQFCTFATEISDDLTSILPVDPAGSPSVTSGSLDTFARDVAVSYTDRGVLRTWTAVLDIHKSMVAWLITSTVKTGVTEPSLASTSSIRKSAVIDSSKTGLTLWDMVDGQLEYTMKYEGQDQVQDLDWSSTPDNQSILAIGFPHKVTLLAQMRFDYLTTGPAWSAIREIQIRESTPYPIGDSVWLGNGNLVIGAGNQLFVYDKDVVTSDDMIRDLQIPLHEHKAMDLFKLISYLNGPLPLFHPQFLGQCILAGKTTLVQQIIVALYKALRFFTSGDDLDSFVSLPPERCFQTEEANVGPAKHRTGSYNDRTEDEMPEIVTEDLAALVNLNLAKLAIPQLSSHEQMHLADIIECVATAEKHRQSMDDNAMRYLLFFRQHMLRKGQAPHNRVDITWREIVWAYHSGSQDVLVDLISRQFGGRICWDHAKESGMFMWITDLSALRAQFELIARNEYTKTDEKNPIDCSLYYIALRKKNVLMGLWRMAAWNREQSATQRLLSNNFQESRWKTAALKNAYALLGRHRFEYAAAFFLLADNLQGAVDVCANQLQDLQLAIAVARVYEGDEGPVLRSLLEDRVLPQAALEGNRWLATWVFWMLGRRDMALRVLISPVYTLIDTPETPSLQSRSYLSSDPALVVFYKQLRDKTLQTLKGASKITPRAEWEFVIQNARLYDRMGCDLLALDLVRNWEFHIQPREPPRYKDEPPDPRKLLRRRSSLVVDDLPNPKPRTDKISIHGKPSQKPVFEEPSANSLLDNFGF